MLIVGPFTRIKLLQQLFSFNWIDSLSPYDFSHAQDRRVTILQVDECSLGCKLEALGQQLQTGRGAGREDQAILR